MTSIPDYLPLAMPTPPDPSGFVRFEGVAARDHSLPVDVLTKFLAGLQQTALLIAASDEPTVGVPKRFRPSDTLRRTAELRVGIPEAGSFVLPLANRFSGTLLAGPLLPRLHAFLAAVGSADVVGMKAAIPDSVYRERAIREVATFLPRPGDRWSADFSGDPARTAVRLDRTTREVVERVVGETLGTDVLEVVGELVKLDFVKERVTISYRPTNRLLACPYPFDKEDRLIGSRRTQVKVTGLFVLDGNGNPTGCVRADSIEPFDLSPFDVAEVRRDGRVFTIDPPLHLEPVQDDESRGAVLVATDPDLGLQVYAKNRDQLIREAEDYVAFLWDAYAAADESDMTDDAVELARRVRKRVTEGGNAA